VSDPVRDAAQRLATAGVDNPRLDARILYQHAKGDGSLYESLVARRVAREPLAYIVGRKEFWSLDFDVGPGVLVPRPETETIIEQALAHFPDRSARLRVLDLGTGSGALLVAFLKEFPCATGIGVDSSKDARGCAEANLARHGLAERGKILAGEWATSLAGPFEAILANPPYIPSADIDGLEPEVSRYEPRAALDGGPDGMSAYRALAREIARLLGPPGLALLEIGIGQGDAVSGLMAGAGLRIHGVYPDLAGIPRIVAAARKE